MHVFLYKIGIYLYYTAIQLAAPFKPKAKLWLQGRKNIWETLQEKLNQYPPTTSWVWFHAASLGEFEQGRPVIEAFRKENPHIKILLSFYSPSGYELRKNYTGADIICYLPLDTPANAKRWLAMFRPQLVFFIKYEFWYFFLRELHQQQIPVLLISAIFRPNQLFFRWYGSFYKNILFYFHHIFVQNQSSLHLLENIGYKNATVAGDTRTDRVLSLAKNPLDIPIAARFTEGKKILVAGSTWEADEKILTAFFKKYPACQDWKFIIAPHEIQPEGIERFRNACHLNSILFSEATENTDFSSFQILIIDNIGLLNSLYRYAKVAYIGGGFGKGIHNTLEPAAYSIPVLFGKNYHKFQEAKDLIQLNAAFEIKDEYHLIQIIDFLDIDSNYTKAAKTAGDYILQNSGASAKIMSQLASLKIESA